MATVLSLFFFFFFNDTATTEIYTLSLHDALPICCDVGTVLAQTGEVGGGSMTGIDEGHERLRVDSGAQHRDRKSTRLNSSHTVISYAVFCLKKKKKHYNTTSKISNNGPTKTEQAT